MMKKREYLQRIILILLLLAAIIVLFQWYTTQNRQRMKERNMNYAADSARQTADQIDKELNNALNLICCSMSGLCKPHCRKISETT